MEVHDLVGPVVIHSNDAIHYATDPFCQLVGVEHRDEVLGKSLVDFVPAPPADQMESQFERLLGGETPTLALRLHLEGTDGTSKDVIAVNSLVEWEGTERIHTTFIDIPESNDEVTLPVKESAIHEAPVGISIADATSEGIPLVYVNDGFLELTGYPREEAIGRNCRFLQGEDTREEPVAEMRRALDNEEPTTVELRNYRKDGSMFWNRVTVSPVENQTGDVTHYLGFQEDITDEKLYERERGLFKKHAEVSNQVMFITDETGTIEYVNPAFERVTGYSASEAVGENADLLKSGEQDDSFYKDLWETIQAGDVWEDTLTNQTKSGELYQVHQTIVPIVNDRGKVTNFTAIERDITDAQLTDQVLDVLNRILRHNVRTSINVIDGYTEYLDTEIEDPELRTALDVIGKRTDALSKITEQTTTIRNLISGHEDPSPLPLSRVENIVDRSRETHDEAEILFELNGDGSPEIRNGSVFEVAFEEAVDNAVVHNNTATPVVDITVTPQEETGMVLVEIADNGPGIPKSEWEIIKIGQETPLVHTQGIGLWLLYWAMTALGGSVTMDANEPHGTVLTLEVPLVAAFQDG
jgi:PAS domain S-box-containing protein